MMEDCGLGVRVLFCHHTRLNFMSPPRLSSRQVICGPFCPDHWENGEAVSLQTPAGVYDIMEVVARLPAHQQPELLLVKSDATRANFPVNLDRLGVPKVLVIGDTQHMQAPLQTMLSYACDQKYDLYLSDHKRHHLHYFIEAGLANVHWLPGLFVKDWQIPFQRRRELAMCFVGQAGAFHPRRMDMLRGLNEAGVPLLAGTWPPDEASRTYARFLLTLNQSLNGDMNLRVFETLLAGGCLVTDALAPQSGLDLLFEDRTHLVTYASHDALLETARHYLAHPGEALAIAERGQRLALERHRSAVKLEVLRQMLFAGRIPHPYAGGLDRRGLMGAENRAAGPAGFAGLLRRVALYEIFQDLHRTRDAVSVCALPGADPRLVADLADLPRLSLSWRDRVLPPLLEAAGVAEQVAAAPDAPLAAADVLLVGAGDAAALEAGQLPGMIVDTSADPAIGRHLAGCGFTPSGDHPALFCKGTS